MRKLSPHSTFFHTSTYFKNVYILTFPTALDSWYHRVSGASQQSIFLVARVCEFAKEIVFHLNITFILKRMQRRRN